MDLCAGTGCISLALFSRLNCQFPSLKIKAVDLNTHAQALALKTVQLNQRLNRLPHSISNHFKYVIGDILDPDWMTDFSHNVGPVDVVISNPPYISIPAFRRDTSRSARIFEPVEALVPNGRDLRYKRSDDEATGDVFYPHILRFATQQQAKIVVMEVADMEQAQRVLEIARREETWTLRQIWCDEIDVYGNGETETNGDRDVTLIGKGNGRAVVLARDWGVSVIKGR